MYVVVPGTLVVPFQETLDTASTAMRRPEMA